MKVVPCLCLDFPVPAPMRLRSGVGSDPGDRPTNQGHGELQPRPPGAETGTTSGHRSGAREREGGGAGRRLPGVRSRGTLGVFLGCLGLGALCALAAGPRPLAGPAAPASLPAPPPAAPLKRPRSSASAPPWTPRSRMICSSCSSPPSPSAVKSRPEPAASAPPDTPPVPPSLGTHAVPLSPGRCSELDLDGMQRVVGGTEARSHAWPYQVSPAGVPRAIPGLSSPRDPALRAPCPCLAPSPDLPPVLLRRQLAPHLRRLPHPEELGDDRRPLREQVSRARPPPSSRQSSFPPKPFPSRDSGCPEPQSSRPWRAFGRLRQRLRGAAPGASSPCSDPPGSAHGSERP